MRLGEVFVPGGLPSVTYNPRESLRLEEQVRDYVDERHKILSLSGPTKSGKTVLLKTVLPPAIWISGGSITTAETFWEAVVDNLGAYTSESAETSTVEHNEEASDLRGGVGLPKVLHVETGTKDTTGTDRGRRQTHSRDRSPSQVALKELRQLNPILIVDDFHYIETAVQLALVRGLKELVFEGLPVIFASVPHRAFDAVRVEREMTGRVEQVKIEFWSDDELRGIAEKGFEALNVDVDPEVLERLVGESFRSPHLMQGFCLRLCKDHGIRETCTERKLLGPPDDWTGFFRASAQSASKTAFDLLRTGPRQRTDRKERILKDGTSTDIYGTVLAAIAATGPLTELPYTELRTSIREVVQGEPPQRHEVTRVLDEMTKIARDTIEGEPVVDYDEELETLHISDPFFAYFLRWGITGS